MVVVKINKFGSFYPNFGTFKSEMNKFETNSVLDSDEFLYKYLYAQFGEMGFLLGSRNRNLATTFEKWSVVKNVWIKLLGEKKKPILDLIDSKSTTQVFLGDITDSDEQINKYFDSGNTNVFQPDLLTSINRLVTSPLVFESIKETFFPLFFTMGPDEDNGAIDIEVTTDDVEKVSPLEGVGSTQKDVNINRENRLENAESSIETIGGNINVLSLRTSNLNNVGRVKNPPTNDGDIASKKYVDDNGITLPITTLQVNKILSDEGEGGNQAQININKENSIQSNRDSIDGNTSHINWNVGAINTNTENISTTSDNVLILARKTSNLNDSGQVINVPESDKDIATKKYVDDNAGGGGSLPWKDLGSRLFSTNISQNRILYNELRQLKILDVVLANRTNNLGDNTGRIELTIVVSNQNMVRLSTLQTEKSTNEYNFIQLKRFDYVVNEDGTILRDSPVIEISKAMKQGFPPASRFETMRLFDHKKDIDPLNAKVINLGDDGRVLNEPKIDEDIATKKYVDDNAGGGGSLPIIDLGYRLYSSDIEANKILYNELIALHPGARLWTGLKNRDDELEGRLTISLSFKTPNAIVLSAYTNQTPARQVDYQKFGRDDFTVNSNGYITITENNNLNVSLPISQDSPAEFSNDLIRLTEHNDDVVPLQAKTSNLGEDGRVINAPTNDGDIATKKYVDDNASGGGLSPVLFQSIIKGTGVYNGLPNAGSTPETHKFQIASNIITYHNPSTFNHRVRLVCVNGTNCEIVFPTKVGESESSYGVVFDFSGFEYAAAHSGNSNFETFAWQIRRILNGRLTYTLNIPREISWNALETINITTGPGVSYELWATYKGGDTATRRYRPQYGHIKITAYKHKEDA